MKKLFLISMMMVLIPVAPALSAPNDGATAVAMFASNRFEYGAYNIQNALHKRLGDLHSMTDGEKMGAWIRTYSNRGEYKTVAKTKLSSTAVEIGFDSEIKTTSNAHYILGFSIGSNFADQRASAVSSMDAKGNITVPYISIYGTAVFDNGLYVDVIGRGGFLDSKSNYYDPLNNKIGFDSKSEIGIVSAEVGYQYKGINKFIFEPRMELAYSYIGEDTFVDDAGRGWKYDSAKSLVGSVGILAHYEFNSVRPYAKFTYMHEFNGRTKVEFGNFSDKVEIPEDRFEMGLGLTADLVDNTNLYIEVTYLTGNETYRNYNANIGLRVNF